MTTLTKCRLAAAVLTLAALVLPAAGQESREATYRRLALKAAESYRSDPALYTYAPRGAADEAAASTIAMHGHILLEAFRATNDGKWLEPAKAAGDSLVRYTHMNSGGRAGWGRYWKLAGPSGDTVGGHTTHARDCVLERNKAYDAEMYDVARVLHFLTELYRTTKTRAYLDIAKQVADDTWNDGDQSSDGLAFYYFKTIGACDRGWRVKAVNMLMAPPMALLALETGQSRYRQRAEQLMTGERREIDRVANGRPAPNFGYYAIETMREKGGSGGYVGVAQTTDPGNPISCNIATSSGESCSSIIGMEARGLLLAGDVLGKPHADYRPQAIAIMNAYRQRDADLCSGERTKLGFARSYTGCVAYYCAVRKLSRDFDDACFDRVTKWGVQSQDAVLGLFWGG